MNCQCATAWTKLAWNNKFLSDMY